MRGVQRVLIWAVLQSQRSDCAEDRENEEIIIQAEVPFAHGPSREYCRQPLPNRVNRKAREIMPGSNVLSCTECTENRS